MSLEFKVNLRRVLLAWTVLRLGAVSSSPQGPPVPFIEEMAKGSDLVIIGKVLRNRPFFWAPFVATGDWR